MRADVVFRRSMTGSVLANSEIGKIVPVDSPIGVDERYRLLVEAVTDYAIYMLDLDGTIRSWNPGARRFKGYEADEIIGQHFSRFYTDEDRQSGLPARALATALRDSRFEGEGWRVRKDGTRFWANVVIDLIRDRAGKPLGFAKVTRDLTEHKAAEEALRRSDEQFRLLVQSVTDYSLYMLGPDGRVASWNAGAERIKGYRADEIIGAHFSQFYTDEDRENGLPRLALETAASEGRYEKEGWRVRKDGTRFWANVVIDAIKNSAGTLIGFAKITRDITERRDNQIALEKAREALFQSQKMDAIGQLTGGVAHDFNNLLTAILGSLELARRRVAGDPALTRLIDNATRGAERGSALTQRMLAFARRQDLKFESVDIPSLMHGMTELLERSLGPTIAIETRFPLGLKRVNADANQLEMAVLNLVVNARDAMPNGGPIIMAARTEKVLPGHDRLGPGEYVCLSIADSGEGMSDETLARAMEPFFTTKGLGKGTGLGLSMVHGLAEQSGGGLVLKSRKGEGTTAEIYLPIALQVTVPDVVSAEAQVQMLGRMLTVLVVDDDSLVLTNLSVMLEDLGHTVIEAGSAREALSELRGQSGIDLVITDYAMPNVTGLQLIKDIEAEWPEMPVILATGYAELPPETSVALPRLPKPYLQQDIVRVVNDTINARPRRDARSPAPT